ncbi:MAG TPA: hypothetical protein DD490_07920 [Acidobacteria bacterium]|nr:hypothetical protein [Acidobacteriota bacterium]
MLTPGTTEFEKIRDPELADWLLQESGEVREVLVDADLPRRTVTLDGTGGGRPRATGLHDAAGSGGRQEILRRLRALLEPFLDTPPVVLEAAGAVAVRATGRQVRGFVDHPLVKAVRPNRRLRHAG